jgi:PAS domain S-box-containing protein
MARSFKSDPGPRRRVSTKRLDGVVINNRPPSNGAKADVGNTNQPGSPHYPFLELVTAAIIITDISGIITYWNPFAEELYGWTSPEVVGRSIMDITVSAETNEEARKHMAALRAGNAWSGEFKVRCKTGALLDALVTLSPIVDETNSVIGIVGVSQDLTERKHVEEKLRRAQIELESRVRERTLELDTANQGLRDLSTSLLHLRDQESRRIARELHDSVGQLVAAMTMNIAKVRSQAHKLDDAGAKALEENTLLLQQINTEIRTISHLLHPPLLDEIGLSSALRWYVEEFSQRSRIKVDLDVPRNLRRLSVDMETAIFRIVQECLTNIHRHSGSKVAAIRVLQHGHTIRIIAHDSGKGISPEKLRLTSTGRSGVGFRGMAERIRYLGGNLKIDSNTTGTVITATLPLEQLKASAAAACAS